MTEDGLTAARIGMVAASSAILEGVLYLTVIAIIIVQGTMPPLEPWASFVAALLLLTVPTLIALSVAVCWLAPAGRRPWAVLAVVCTAIFAVYVSFTRLLQLALLRPVWDQTMPAELALLHPYQMPSLGFTLEIAGWGLWLGLVFIGYAAIFAGSRRAITIVFGISGVLSILAGLAPILGIAWLTTLGIIAWGPGLLAGTVLLALEFRDYLRTSSVARTSPGM